MEVIAFLFVAAAGTVRAEPMVGRDATPLLPWHWTIEAGADWAASRAGFDDEHHLLPLASTPGAAWGRDASVAARAGFPGSVEARISGGYVTQEVKLDRGTSASGWEGSDIFRGEGAQDVLLTVMWTPLRRATSAAGVEVGVRAPAARGPGASGDPYRRLGDGAWSFPVGLRLAHRQEPITGYAAGGWEQGLTRKVARWAGSDLGAAVTFRPGAAYWFAFGAEVDLAPVTWALEIAKEAHGRDRGGIEGTAPAGSLLPGRGELWAQPSVSVPAGCRARFHVGVHVPLDGRNVYQMFGVSLLLRVTG